MSASSMAGFARRLAFVGVAGAIAATGVLAVAPAAGAMTSTEATAANATLSMLNQERSANGLPALRMSTALISSARRHNLTMAAANTLSHQLPGEPVFSTRISQAGVNWHSAAENIGYTTNKTTAGAQSLESAMYNEVAPNDGHRRNILSSSLSWVGIDIYIDSRTGKLWLTEDFADVSGPTSTVASTAHNPVGHLDKAAALAGHKLYLAGWAYDPDASATPLRIDIYVDGHIFGNYRTPMVRNDVATAKHVGSDQGWTATLGLTAGRHYVKIYAINVGAGSSTLVAYKLYGV